MQSTFLFLNFVIAPTLSSRRRTLLFLKFVIASPVRFARVRYFVPQHRLRRDLHKTMPFQLSFFAQLSSRPVCHPDEGGISTKLCRSNWLFLHNCYSVHLLILKLCHPDEGGTSTKLCNSNWLFFHNCYSMHYLILKLCHPDEGGTSTKLCNSNWLFCTIVIQYTFLFLKFVSRSTSHRHPELVEGHHSPLMLQQTQ
jgi:hypothetical protein